MTDEELDAIGARIEKAGLLGSPTARRLLAEVRELRERHDAALAVVAEQGIELGGLREDREIAEAEVARLTDVCDQLRESALLMHGVGEWCAAERDEARSLLREAGDALDDGVVPAIHAALLARIRAALPDNTEGR